MKILFLYTKRMLAANKARTAVTFAGIVLSFALLTAVLTGTSSLFHFFSEFMKVRDPRSRRSRHKESIVATAAAPSTPSGFDVKRVRSASCTLGICPVVYPSARTATLATASINIRIILFISNSVSDIGMQPIRRPPLED